MKGEDIIMHAIRTEMPDMEQLRQNCIRQATMQTTVKRNVWVARLVPVAACAILLFAMYFALPHLRNTTPNMGRNLNGDYEGGIVANDNRDYESGIIANGNGNNSHEGQGNGTFPYYQPNEEQVPHHTGNILPPEFVGLPVVNHCLPQENPMASRMGVGSLLDILGPPGRAVQFWTENPVQAFAYVRVLEAVQEGSTLISTVEVLKTVWSQDRELPETMTLVQHSGAIMCCSPYGELMREGGVFLLPLWYNDGSMSGWREGWFNWTYFDVLFEVDDNGLIWSRSNFSAFNRFDDRHTSVLTNAILGIANGEENLGRDIAHSHFGFAADESVLAVVTAISSESRLLWADIDMWTNWYTVRVDEVLSIPTPYGLQRGGWFEQQQRWRENWQVNEQWWQGWEHDGEITAVNYTRNLLEAGEQYLVFITPSYGDWSSPFNFFWESAASINADGTITPIRDVADNLNVFGEYNGYTVERLSELAKLANTWHEMYAQ